MKSIIALLMLSFSLYAGNINTGNYYVDEVNPIFNEDCRIISDQSIKDAVVLIADQYQGIAHRTDAKCSPEAVAPDLNNLIRGPVCEFLGSQSDNYDFCNARPTDPAADTTAMDLNPMVEDIPWAKTVGALVSYTEIMIRNECFEKMVGNGQNWGQVASNFLGVIQNISMATAPLEPTMASIAIGSRLGMILFSGIGAIQQALEERARSVDPLTFSTKMCGLRKYLLNRQRATCLSNCAGALESANQALKDQMCQSCDTTKAFVDFTTLSGQYDSYAKLLTNISSFDLQNSNQLLTPDQRDLTNNFVSTIDQDRSLIATKLGYESPLDFTDKYFDIRDESDPRFGWLDYEKPTTTISDQKDDINLIMGLPGLIMKDHLCDDPEKKILGDPFFNTYMHFSEEATNEFCEKMAIYHRCGANKGWRDNEQDECQKERAKLSTSGYSPLKRGPFRNFMNALQVQKLTQETKSNNSSCFTVEHCEKNRYNCMALLASYDGSNSCGSLAGLTSDSRQLQFLQKVKDFDYVQFHRQNIQQGMDRLEGDSDYQRYLNLRFAQEEIETLLKTVTTKDDYDKCMEGRRQYEREKECLAEYTYMKRTAMQTINKCIFDDEAGYTADSGKKYAETTWKEFFKTGPTGGNLKATVRRVLNAKKDPWTDLKKNPTATPMSQEQMDSLAESLCKTLYCPLSQLDAQSVGFNLFDIFTWFGGENPPVIRHSSAIRRYVRDWCGPRLGSTDKEREEFMECKESQCQTIVSGVSEGYRGPDNTLLDLSQCLPPTQ